MGLAFIYPALPTCRAVCVHKLDFHLINVFCMVIVKKCAMYSPGILLLFCTAQQQDTFGAYNQSYTFAQPTLQTTRWS